MTPGSDDRPADSAGVPFEGRTFHENPNAGDDGSAPPKVIEAIRRFKAKELGIADVVAALHGERLLIPLVAERGDEGVGAFGQTVDKTQELSIVTVEGPDGRPVLPAFTSADAMRVWNPAARPIPIEAARIALAVASEGTPLIVIDPKSPTELIIRRPAYRALATGERWVPCFEDEAVLEAFLDSAKDEPTVRAIQLAPGDPNSRLAGAELLVQLSLDGGLDQAGLDALLERLNTRWSSTPTIATRVDSIGVRVDRI
jgi:hypothetical protein